MAGDLNIAHTRADLRNWKGNLGKAGFLPEEQAYLDRWLERGSGWTCPAGRPGRWRARTRGGPGAARPSTTTPGGGSTTSSPPPHWPPAAGTWVGRAATYAERWSDHAAVVADYDLADGRPRVGRRQPTDWAHDGDQAGRVLADGHGRRARARGAAIPGAGEFIRQLIETERRFLVLTNNSIFTPRDLRARLLTSGIDIPEASIWTSALATAQFLDDQRPGGSAYVIGEAGLTTALHDVGYVLTERAPDYVVLGETRTYSFEGITRAIRLVEDGSRFIATNPDPPGRPPRARSRGSVAPDHRATGVEPYYMGKPNPLMMRSALNRIEAHSRQGEATGSVAALITRATGVEPYFIGKPNPLMMRSALNRMDAHSESTVMIGDRMDTDIISGLEAGLRTILVLTGSTQAAQVDRFPFRPTRVVDSVADLVPLIDELDPAR